MTESIILARKPLTGTVARNVLAHGTGAINVDACRTGHASAEDLAESQSKNPGRDDRATSDVYGADRPQQSVNASGRWPANVLLSHAPILDEFGWPVGDACAGGCVPGCAVAELDGQSGTRRSAGDYPSESKTHGMFHAHQGQLYADSGGASRFFPTFRYQAVVPVTETRDDMTDEAAPPTVTLYPGDCLAVLATLPDESISAVITDPPYGLSDLKPAAVLTAMTAWANGDRDHVPDARGFMGRDWDAFVPPPAVWDECLRVLKPGGYLAAFAGSRTQDLMGLSIRMAGFEIRDGLQWLYGCLTADAEVLTEHGWRHGVDVERGERVAQWDPATGAISLAAVEETYRAPWDGPMRVLRNADTDQVLTPNHRVYHRAWRREQVNGVRRGWYRDEWEVAEAGDLSTWNTVQLPLAGEHDGPGIGGVDYAALLGWVWTEGGFDPQWNGVRIYQSSVNADKVDQIAALLDRLGPHKRYDYERTYTRRNGERHDYTAVTWFLSGALAQQVRADLPGKRPTYDLLWRMTGAEKRAMLAAALLGDGHVDSRGTWQLYQRHEDDLVWLQTLLALVGQAGKVGMRPDRDNGTVYVRNRATTELQAKHLRNQSEHYTGEVWCVRVPTGAFVARRNGLVFITGNSGFPKGLDVGKAIDKMAGAEREVVGTHHRHGGGSASSGSMSGDLGTDSELPLTAPATDAARQWQGWNTALKPSVEPIILARRPLSGTVSANVLAHGTGAVNVDATRVGASDKLVRPSITRTDNEVFGKGLGAGVQEEPAGRWPANVLLSHAPLLDEHGEPVGDACADGCVEGCPVAELDGQSGTLSNCGGPKRTTHDSGMFGIGQPGHVYSDSGGASRFFPTFRYAAKAPKKERPTIDGKGWPTVKPLGLMQWLARLLCPPGGVILDPFPGTGTTGQAAQREGFESILIERDPFARDLVAVRIPDVVLGAVPISEASCPIHGEHGGTVDCVDCLYPETPAEPEPAPEPVEDAGDLVAASLYGATDVAELHAIRAAVPTEAWHPDFDEILAARAVELDPVLSAIAAASSGAELRAAHVEHLSAWSEEYTAALVARVNELATVQDTVA